MPSIIISLIPDGNIYKIAVDIASILFPLKQSPILSSQYQHLSTMISRNLLAAVLLPTFFALSNALSIPTDPTIIQQPAQNFSSLTLSPWPPAPYRFSVPKSPAYLSFSVRLTAYGPPGPSSTIEAEALLKTLAKQVLLVPAAPYERIRDFTESASGVGTKFTAIGQGIRYGVARTQVATLFDRLRQLTRVHGAVGWNGEMEVDGKVVEKFTLEWMFE